jgi:hypothetical protein
MRLTPFFKQGQGGYCAEVWFAAEGDYRDKRIKQGWFTLHDFQTIAAWNRSGLPQNYRPAGVQ